MVAPDTTSVELDISYHGPSLEGGQMNVRDIAPAMLAVGSLFELSNQQLNGETATVKINVRATSAGSFHIVFDIFQNLDLSLIGDMITTANDLKGLLFGGAGIIGLITFIKGIRGRTPQKIERVNNSIIRLTLSEEESYEIPIELLRMYQDIKIRNELSNILKPLKEEGIDSLEIQEYNETIESVSKSEVDYFDVPEIQEPIIDQIRTQGFSIVSLAFREGNKWRLTDGQSTFSVSMKDGEFQTKVDNSEIAFSSGDTLICDLRIVQWQTNRGIKTEYEVVKIHDHKPARQPKLPGLEE